MLVMLFGIYRYFFSETDDARYYIMDDAFEDNTEAYITGMVYNCENKEKNFEVYLKDVSVNISSNASYKLRNLLVYIPKTLPDSPVSCYKPDNYLKIYGTIYKIQSPSNPGQFNQKEYLREKNICYTASAKSVNVSASKGNSNIFKNLYNVYLVKIQNVKEKLTEIYRQALPEKESSIVTAMLLGNKTFLDMDIKNLYQESGISHILAISGLHISIICMAAYKLAAALAICICKIIKRIYKLANNIQNDVVTPGYVKMTNYMCTVIHITAALAAIVFIIIYGRMTGFGISVARAVIMAVLMLIAPLIRRSYDMLSAMASSAIIILLNKPFAIYSCSFLLSFGAVAGIALVYPVLKKIYLKKQKSPSRHNTFINLITEKTASTFLSSIAIQLTTLPFILYFYYEFPLYGIFINIVVIPLASLLVMLCVTGGIAGLICLPLAKFILGSAYILLNIYEIACRAVSNLPCNIIITGKPDIWQIIIYFVLLATALAAAYFYINSEEEGFKRQNSIYKTICTIINPYSIKAVFFIIISLAFFTITFVNTYTKKYSGLKLAFLDIGQGDAIFMQDNSGTVYLIDGGSSSVNSVGKYRIIPYLKCNGIKRIDYMIMTHSDEDHISGLKEILQQSRTGIKVANLLLPDPSASCKNDSYYEIANLASKNSVNTAYIGTGDIFSGSGGFKIQCLHPETGFNAESANAYSTVLSVVYKNTSFLLTGDTEGNGEDMLLKKLQEDSTLPVQYNILKVAHHGSKNSTSDAFLDRVSPDISIISCGKNNMYGHPHKELLERLEKAGSRWIATKDAGAVTVFSDGESIKVLREEGAWTGTLLRTV